MKKKVVSITQTIRANETLMPEGFSGWYAQNIGTANVEVDGFVLGPGDTIDFSHITAIWSSPIVVVCLAGDLNLTRGILRITRLQYI